MCIKNFTLRIDKQLLDKIKIIAQYESRSANSQIVVVMQRYVKAFEGKHGEI
ncbi:MAG: Arc family DNA-binding protein [Oscillospiraceae bacterium]|nr:Arc family DNA-binding protein [Oscillospiraceae bacterium]